MFRWICFVFVLSVPVYIFAQDYFPTTLGSRWSYEVLEYGIGQDGQDTMGIHPVPLTIEITENRLFDLGRYFTFSLNFYGEYSWYFYEFSEDPNSIYYEEFDLFSFYMIKNYEHSITGDTVWTYEEDGEIWEYAFVTYIDTFYAKNEIFYDCFKIAIPDFDQYFIVAPDVGLIELFENDKKLVILDYQIVDPSEIRVHRAPSAAQKIFPNPSEGVFFLGGELEEAEEFIVTDPLGRKIYQGRIKNNKQIDLSNLSNGSYLLYLSGETVNSVEKIIKN